MRSSIYLWGCVCASGLTVLSWALGYPPTEATRFCAVVWPLTCAMSEWSRGGSNGDV